MPRRARSAATSISTCSARRTSPCTATGAARVACGERGLVGERLHLGQLGQRLEQRRGLRRRRRRRRRTSSGTRSRRRQAHLAAQAAAGADQGLEPGHPGVGRGVELLGLRLRVGRGDDAVAAPAALRPATGATVSHSSAVMNGVIGCSRRSTVSSTRISVRRVARCCAGAAAWRSAPWRSRGTSRSTRPRRSCRSRWRRCRAGSRRSPAPPRLPRAAARR